MPSHKTKSAAVLTIYNAPGMTKRRRFEVQGWLRTQARLLERGSKTERSTRFRATRTMLTLKQPNTYSAQGRKAIAAWLRQHAKFLGQYGKEFSKRFIGRYLTG